MGAGWTRRRFCGALAAGLGAAGCGRGAEPILVGILHSRTGTMATSELGVIDATILALEEVNAEGGLLDRPVGWTIADGASSEETFAREAERLIVREKVRALFGCWTSANRKAVKAVVERYDHLLFYPVQYEGCEASPNIVYLGAAPNQQIIPAVSWAMEARGGRVFLVGSDYIFPRTAHAIIRDQVEAIGGTVLGERYLPLGDVRAEPIAEAVAAAGPDVVFNTINGDANAPFFAAMARQSSGGRMVPIVSFSLSEDEIRASEDPSAFVGHYAAWNYFERLDHPRNVAFLSAFRRRFGSGRVVSDPMEAAYCGVKLWAQAVRDARTDELSEVRPALGRQSLEAPEGNVSLDPGTQHAWKVARIGRVRRDGQFEVVWSSGRPIRPAPFPVWRSRSDWEGLVDGFHRAWGGRWSNPGPSEARPGAAGAEPSR